MEIFFQGNICFSVNLFAGEGLVADIDFGQGFGDSVDARLFVFNPSGVRVAQNDDASTFAGSGGSSSRLDSFVSFEATSSGNHRIAVSSFNNDPNSGAIFNGRGFSDGDYLLQLSIDRDIDPLVLSLSDDGLKSANFTKQKVAFDMNADGLNGDLTSWIQGKAGFLAYDRNGNQRIDDISELFSEFSV